MPTRFKLSSRKSQCINRSNLTIIYFILACTIIGVEIGLISPELSGFNSENNVFCNAFDLECEVDCTCDVLPHQQVVQWLQDYMNLIFSQFLY